MHVQEPESVVGANSDASTRYTPPECPPPGISACYADDEDGERNHNFSLEELRIACQTSETSNGTDTDPSLLADFLSRS